MDDLPGCGGFVVIGGLICGFFFREEPRISFEFVAGIPAVVIDLVTIMGIGGGEFDILGSGGVGEAEGRAGA